MRTLSIDVGGSGIKLLILDPEGRPVTDRRREPTPAPATPDAVLACIRTLIEGAGEYDRVSVGFPGVISDGVVLTAVNLEDEAWRGFELEGAVASASGRPTRVVNDADLQGYGVIEGRGVELVLTLGTGMGSALFTHGRLVPNLELGHHPFEKEQTYEERVGEAELDRIGKKRWRRRVARALDHLRPVFNPDRIHVGGGNAKHLRDLPEEVRVFDNVEGLTGGVHLWGHGD